MIHKFTIETRHYEQDSSFHINNSNYLRYLEEARISMMNDKKFRIRSVYEENILMVVYKIICNYKKQIHYPQKLRIESKQIQTKKVRGVLRQEIFDEMNELCFSADAYWAYVSQDKVGQKKVLEFTELFGSNEVAEIIPFKSTIEVDTNYFLNSKIFNLYKFEVRPYELDGFQHVNNSVYANYFEMGRWSFRKDVLDDIDFFKNRKQIFVLYKNEIHFKEPCFNFEKLILKTFLIEVKKFRIIYYQEIRSENQVLKSYCISEGCIVNEKGQPVQFDKSTLLAYEKKLSNII